MKEKKFLYTATALLIPLMGLVVAIGVSENKKVDNISSTEVSETSIFVEENIVVEDIDMAFISAQKTTEETTTVEITETKKETEEEKSPIENEHPLPVKRYVNISALNIRKKPSSDAEIVGQVYLCDEIDVLENTVDNEWGTICYQGQYLYVATKYLSIEMPIIEEEPVINKIQHYSVNGVVLSTELQDYAYEMCCKYGIDFYYPTVLCQMYQESEFNQGCVSPHGDYGIMQLKGIYHDYFKQLCGHPEYDLINNVYHNIEAGVCYMAFWLNQCGNDIYTGLSSYNRGYLCYYEPYVQEVMRWYPTIREISE